MRKYTKKFNEIEKKVFDEVLTDAKMELSFTENRDVESMCSSYHIRMLGVLEGMSSLINSKQFVQDCLSKLDKREDIIREEINKFARSVA